MAFEIIEGLPAIYTFIQGLASGAPELADQGGMIASAMRTLYGLFPMEGSDLTYLLQGVGRSDTVGFQLILSLLAHPLCRPGGREYGGDLDVPVSVLTKRGHYLLPDHIHGRAAAIRWGYDYLELAVPGLNHPDVTNNTQVQYG